LANHIVGIGAVALALAVSIAGWLLGRRYGKAIEHTGIGRPYPLRHSAAAFLGNALVILGLIGVMIAVMLFFT
jgi:hypothetical protein